MNSKIYLLSLLASLVLLTSCNKDPEGDENALQRIATTWVRVLSNNPANDGMRVGVTTTMGVVIDEAQSSFSVGDTKWDQITWLEDNRYEYQELGSNGNYFSADMNLDGDTLRLSVNAGGAGNQQKWVRESDYNDASVNAVIKLTDTWVRVRSNNPGNDGLEITVAGSNGAVSAEPRNSFTIGTIKWAEITWTGNNHYNYLELGSDGNYYNSTMIEDGDSLRLTVDYAGAGNSQIYVRKDAYTPGGGSDQTIELTCSEISSATTLTNGGAAVDYRVPSGCVINVTSELTVEAGTVIEFGENAGMGVYDNGKLVVLRDPAIADKTVFRGTEDIQGWWRGIHIESQLSNIMRDMEISDAGANYVYCCNQPASLFLKRDGKLTLDNVTISNGEEDGMYVQGDAKLEMKDVIITSHAGYPMNMDFEIAADLNDGSYDFAGNDNDFVRIFKSNSDQENTLYKLNVPYLFSGDVFNITDRLDIEAGIEIQFEENAGWGVIDNGILSINGENGFPVTFKGSNNIKGWWRGIHVETNSTQNKIEYATISDAGANYIYCCNEIASLFLKDGQLTLRNTTIQNGDNYGIYAGNDFEFNEYASNEITTHTNSPLSITMTQAGQLDSTRSVYVGNEDDYLRIRAFNVSEAIEIHKNDVPYLLESVLNVTEGMSIYAGTEIVFEENAGIGIYDNGSFYVAGRAGAEVRFTGLNDVASFWRGIHSETNNLRNVISHAVIDGAGNNYVYCCNDKASLFVKSGIMTVENSEITRSGGCGISVGSSATLTESGNTFSGNTDGNICN